jgi:hypothetical protein
MQKVIKLFLISMIFFFPEFVKSQCYTILSVKGEIILEKTGQPIKEMDEVCATDKLTFSTKDSKAAVLSPEQGRFVIKLEKKTKNALTAFVSSVLFAGKERLSTKYIDDNELERLNINFYKEEFGSEYFIIKESKIFVDSKYYPMNDNNYFYLKYTYDGKEIESRLKSNNETLYISRDAFNYPDISVEPEKIDSVEFFYFDKEKRKKIRLTAFTLKFADENKLYSELSNFISILKKAEKSNYIITQEVINFLNDIYGNVNWDDVQPWLSEKFGIK